MYKQTDIQFVGKHDYDKEKAKMFLDWQGKTFSINIFKWEMMKGSKKRMKPSKGIIRVTALCSDSVGIFDFCDNLVKMLDNNEIDLKKKSHFYKP